MKWSVHGHQWPFLLCLAVVARPNDGNQTKKGHTASMTLTLTLSSIRSMDAVESLWQYYCRILTTSITIILSVFVLIDRKIQAVYPSLPATIQLEQGHSDRKHHHKANAFCTDHITLLQSSWNIVKEQTRTVNIAHLMNILCSIGFSGFTLRMLKKLSTKITQTWYERLCEWIWITTRRLYNILWFWLCCKSYTLRWVAKVFLFIDIRLLMKQSIA